MDRTLLSRCRGSYLFYVVVVLVILCSIDKIIAQKTVAYYPFENSYRPLATGQCPTPSYFNSPSGTATFAASNPARSGIGQAVAVDSTASTPTTLSLGTWSISSSSYSIACWIYVNSFPGNPNNVRWNVVTKGGSSWSIDLVTKNNPKLQFVAGLSSGGTASITGKTQLGGNTGWFHAVAVFDSVNDQLRLYTNGVNEVSTTIPGLSPSETTSPISVGQEFHGLVDELYFFDYALTASQANALYQKTTTTTIPTITLPTGPLIIPVGQLGFVNGSVTNGNPVSLQWSLQASCIAATFGSPSSAVTSVIIDGEAFQTYTVNLVATDTVTTLCTTKTVDVTLDGTLPGFDPEQSVLPPKNQLPVPLGSVGTITIALTGSPTPKIKWQELVDVAASGGRRSEWAGLHHPTHPRVDIDWVYERAMAVFALCNATANFTTDCSQWVDIANQTSISYTTPVADLTLNGTMIRFVAYNAKGTYFSTPITIFVTEPTGGGGGGGDGGSDSTGAIVGGVVGGVGGCLLLCCLCILLLVILILLKRRKSDDFPGIPPDYEQVIFGQYLDPMFKVKSKQENSLEKLEKLLISDPGFSLVLAMAAGCKKTEDEKLARSLVYALYPNEKCGASLEILISNLLNATEEKSTLFRANSVETKMVKYYAILVGAPYLWETLARFIWEIQRDALLIDDIDGLDEEAGSSRSMSMSMSSRKVNLKSKSHTLMNMGMEIDPSKMDEAADPKVNTLQLWLTAQKIFSAITRSTDELPKELADFLVFVHNEVETRFSGEEYKAMGGFFFLRFICPSLLAPHLYGLLEEPPSPTAQRQYILIGKVLQNLSNNTLPGAKEEYMNKLNEFITNNQDDLHSYYDKILAARSLSEAQRRVPDQVKMNALAEIHNILISSQKGVEAELANFYEEGDPIYQQLTEIVAGGPIPANE